MMEQNEPLRWAPPEEVIRLAEEAGMSTLEIVRTGYLQRGAKPPRFNNPKLFLRWFRKQKPEVIGDDNVLYTNEA